MALAPAVRADVSLDFQKDRSLAKAIYDEKTGYGFEPGSIIRSETDGTVSSDKPFYFSVAVPEGNYKVTVTLGDSESTSDTTIKAELRRLMLLNVKTEKGKFETRSFVVNVRTPNYPDGKVKLKAPRETTSESRAWDGKLTLEFNGSGPSVAKLEVQKVEVPTAYLLGDSTVCDQPSEPFASWGQMLPLFLKADVAIANHGESGETLASSTHAHRLDKVLSLIKPGDYLFIQFGHNDMKNKSGDALESYENFLVDWVKKTKEKGATPVLVTSMNRHTFEGNQIINSLGRYPDTVRKVAKDENVALIDLNAMSKTLYESFGPKASIQLFEHVAGSEKFDATHHSPFGAYELAKCVVQGIRDNKLELANHILAEVPPFDPAKPDDPNHILIPTSPEVTLQRPLGD